MRRTRRLATRAHRAERREFLAEGPQAVREAVRSDAAVEVFATEDAGARHGDVRAAADDVPWHVVSSDVIEALSTTVHPQGLVARCRFVDQPLADLLETGPALLTVCANVRDPGNAGTVIRCSDAAGADGVVLAGESVDPYNPKAVRASAGSLFHLGLAIDPGVAAVVTALRGAGLRVLAADGAGPVDLDTATDDGLLAAPTAWLFGNEARGLPDEVTALADAVVRVPIHGRAESLNLATAAAVCLYASARAQRSRPY